MTQDSIFTMPDSNNNYYRCTLNLGYIENKNMIKNIIQKHYLENNTIWILAKKKKKKYEHNIKISSFREVPNIT